MDALVEVVVPGEPVRPRLGPPTIGQRGWPTLDGWTGLKAGHEIWFRATLAAPLTYDGESAIHIVRNTDGADMYWWSGITPRVVVSS